MNPKFNAYEFQARQVKLDALVKIVLTYLDTYQLTPSSQVAELLRASYASGVTVDFARKAGVNPPSLKTWDMVCDEIASMGRKAA